MVASAPPGTPGPPSARRSYLLFGLLLTAALGLALHSWLNPRPTAGDPEARAALRRAVVPALARLMPGRGTLVAAHRRVRARHQHREAWPTASKDQLGRPWEQLRAAPVVGGVLLDLRRVDPVSGAASPQLTVATQGELYFVAIPTSPTSPASSAAALPRRRCAGLPARIGGPISVAPDGRSLVLRRTPTAVAELYAFVPAEPGHCRAQLRARLTIGDQPLGRPQPTGRMVWTTDSGELVHWDATGERRTAVPGSENYSGPWWLADGTVALLGETETKAGIETQLVLIDVTGGGPSEDPREGPRRALSAGELFPELEPGSAAASLIDLRPAGDGLLLVTEACPGAALREARPCLHQLRGFVAQAAAQRTTLASPFVLTTVGAIGPLHELATAADGSRVVWSGTSASAVALTLRSTAVTSPPLAPARSLATVADTPRLWPRVAADGSFVVIARELDIAGLGQATTALLLWL